MSSQRCCIFPDIMKNSNQREEEKKICMGNIINQSIVGIIIIIIIIITRIGGDGDGDGDVMKNFLSMATVTVCIEAGYAYRTNRSRVRSSPL